MNCKECGSKVKKFGKDRKGSQRYRCLECKKTFTEEHKRLFESMTIPEEKGLLELKALIEGNSIRSAERLTSIPQRHNHEASADHWHTVRSVL